MYHTGMRFLMLLILSLGIAGCSSLISEGKEIIAGDECNPQDIPLPDYDLKEEEAWIWLDITIGTSTEEELRARLGEPASITFWPQKSYEPQACVYRYQELDNYPTFWLAGGKVIAARFSTSNDQTQIEGQPATIDQAIELYGNAEIVGYNATLGAGYRSVVWLDYGVLAEAYVGGGQQVGTVMYFSPMSEDEFRDSPWSTYVLETNPTVGTDNIDDSPRDPFNWK